MRRNELPDTCFSVLPSTGQLIIIKNGESGYYPSEWDTGNREENREIASNHNVRRGITDIQEAAMLAGSMFGWNTPGANPQWYLDNARYVNSNIMQGHIKDLIIGNTDMRCNLIVGVDDFAHHIAAMLQFHRTASILRKGHFYRHNRNTAH